MVVGIDEDGLQQIHFVGSSTPGSTIYSGTFFSVSCLIDAQRFVLRGDYQDAVAKCRDAIDQMALYVGERDQPADVKALFDQANTRSKSERLH